MLPPSPNLLSLPLSPRSSRPTSILLPTAPFLPTAPSERPLAPLGSYISALSSQAPTPDALHTIGGRDPYRIPTPPFRSHSAARSLLSFLAIPSSLSPRSIPSDTLPALRNDNVFPRHSANLALVGFFPSSLPPTTPKKASNPVASYGE